MTATSLQLRQHIATSISHCEQANSHISVLKRLIPATLSLLESEENLKHLDRYLLSIRDGEKEVDAYRLAHNLVFGIPPRAQPPAYPDNRNNNQISGYRRHVRRRRSRSITPRRRDAARNGRRDNSVRLSRSTTKRSKNFKTC